MKIACVAVVGKNNNPLFVKAFDPQADVLKFHYIVHTSLDVIEDKDSSPSGSKAKGVDMYMGFLCPTEDYKVYGYVTNTKNKLIIVVDDSEVKEHDIKSFFKSFHALFADAVCNPFYTPDEKITSKKFERELVKLVKKRAGENV